MTNFSSFVMPAALADVAVIVAICPSKSLLQRFDPYAPVLLPDGLMGLAFTVTSP